MYFIKDGQTLFRFAQWSDLEDYSGLSRERFSKSLPAAIGKIFPDAEFSGFYGAYQKGWIKDNGEPAEGFTKGNMWRGKEIRNYHLSDFLSQGGKL